MTLDQLLSDMPPLATLRGLWLAFPAAMGDSLSSAQSDQTCHRVQPITLTDGRLALCADLLSEIHPSGIFATPFSRLDPSNFPDVEVIGSAEFSSLLSEP